MVEAFAVHLLGRKGLGGRSPMGLGPKAWNNSTSWGLGATGLVALTRGGSLLECKPYY